MLRFNIVEASTKDKVLELLRSVYPEDLPIKEVAKRLGISRATASKYVAVLEVEGKIICRRVGKAKLCKVKV
jgi:DNA-binding IclR family transcriptional regulator